MVVYNSDDDFALHLDNTEGPVHEALVAARCQRRADLLDATTVLEDGSRNYMKGPRRVEPWAERTTNGLVRPPQSNGNVNGNVLEEEEAIAGRDPNPQPVNGNVATLKLRR